MIAIIYSCKEIKSYSETPQIAFKNAELKIDSSFFQNYIKTVDLKFSLIDGDGDIGSDSVSNFFYKMFYKIDGEYLEYPNPDSIFFKIPHIEQPSGQNKTILADIIVKFEYLQSEYILDTIKYEFYVVDRAKNQSNIEISPELTFTQ
mgnify:CR=1 FL=1|jgi:hypothetical protein